MMMAQADRITILRNVADWNDEMAEASARAADRAKTAEGLAEAERNTQRYAENAQQCRWEIFDARSAAAETA